MSTLRRLEYTYEIFVHEYRWVNQEMKYLLDRASQVRRNAQVRSSRYSVGAALVADNDPALGRTFVGCNVERASHSQTTHAEQNAIDSMVAALGPWKIKAIAIVAGPQNEHVAWSEGNVRDMDPNTLGTPSCGHCLQCIWENCDGNPNVQLIWATLSGFVATARIKDVFPFRFGPSDLPSK